MHPENLAMLARAMPPGAELRLATDIPDYVGHALEAVGAGEAFRHDRQNGLDHATPWPDWPGTRYEAKALRDGRRGHYLTFVRT
jgi:tRNA (guanine-N7-)-methyltransferase